MSKILLVDDDEHFRDAMGLVLKDNGYEVVTAPNGKVAKNILGTQTFDLIISDVQMPFCDGIELHEWVKANCPTKFLMMTGFSNLIEPKDAYARGVTEFLSKPFKSEELTESLKKIFSKKQKTPEPALDQSKYCKVSIDEFVSRPTIDFDVFIKLSETKYIKIGHAGGKIPTEQIDKYKAHGELYLFIKNEDFSKLLGTNMEIAKMLKSNRKISKEKKLNFLKHTGEVLLEKVFSDGLDKQMLNDSSEYLKLTVNAISENADYVDLIDLMNSHSDKLYAKCIATSLYSVLIARKMDMTSSQTFFKLSMAGLFHEIGLKEIDREIVEKPRPLLTTQERKLFESHPLRGQEILLAMGSVPSDVVQLVLEHHEDQNATGFPRGLKKIEQHPLSAIIQLASLFADIILTNKGDAKKSGLGALRYIEETYADRFDPKCLFALKGLFAN